MAKKYEKEIKTYILKNKDIPVLSFEYIKIINKTSIGEYPNYRIKHINIFREDLLPIDFSDPKNSSFLRSWIEKRKIPKNRKNMIHILNFMKNNIKDSPSNFMNYIDVSYGLSLNDSYWIVPENKNLLWKDYNLYQNKFSEIISLIAFGEKVSLENSKGKIRTSPEYTTDGMLAKCWTVIDDDICLLKKSSGDNGKEAYAEYYMDQIAEIMNFDYIKYDLLEYHKNIVSSCKLFTSEDIGFVPMYRCIDKKDLYKSPEKLLLAVSKIYGKESLEDLMIFDSLIYNTDRHLGNFGMLIDNNTKEFIKSAPIFDNGNSILTIIDEDISLDAVSFCYTSKFDISFDVLGKNFVRPRHKAGLEKLKTFKFKKHKKYNLPDEILQKAELFIFQRADFLLKELGEKEKKRKPIDNQVEVDTDKQNEK